MAPRESLSLSLSLSRRIAISWDIPRYLMLFMFYPSECIPAISKFCPKYAQRQKRQDNGENRGMRVSNITRRAGTPGQKLPQPSGVPAPTPPHELRLTGVRLTAWIHTWNFSGPTASPLYDLHGVMPQYSKMGWSDKNSTIISSAASQLDFQGFLSMTNSFLSHAISCQEASRTLGSSQLSVHPTAPAIWILAGIWRRGQWAHHLRVRETPMGRKVLLK